MQTLIDQFNSDLDNTNFGEFELTEVKKRIHSSSIEIHSLNRHTCLQSDIKTGYNSD